MQHPATLPAVHNVPPGSAAVPPFHHAATLPPGHPGATGPMMPPGTLPPSSFRDGPPGTMPPGSMPPGTMPPGSMPPGSMPPGTMPPSTGRYQEKPPPSLRPSYHTPLHDALRGASGSGGEETEPLLAAPPPAKLDPDFHKWHHVRQFLAYMFTVVMFSILAAPTVMSLSLGFDHDVAFWIGRWGLLAFFVPIFLIFQHLYHLHMLREKANLRRYIFIVVPVFPAVFFMILGATYVTAGRALYGQLKSEDCSASGPSPSKWWLQTAYDEAFDGYQHCLERLTKENNGFPLRRRPNLQSCIEWEEMQSGRSSFVPWKGYKIQSALMRPHDPDNLRRWQYLANVEMNHLCGGFCKRGPALFTSFAYTGHAGGECSQYVAFRFLTIYHQGIVIFVTGALVLFFCFPAYILSRSFLNSLGYKSSSVIA